MTTLEIVERSRASARDHGTIFFAEIRRKQSPKAKASRRRNSR